MLRLIFRVSGTNKCERCSRRGSRAATPSPAVTHKPTHDGMAYGRGAGGGAGHLRAAMRAPKLHRQRIGLRRGAPSCQHRPHCGAYAGSRRPQPAGYPAVLRKPRLAFPRETNANSTPAYLVTIPPTLQGSAKYTRYGTRLSRAGHLEEVLEYSPEGQRLMRDYLTDVPQLLRCLVKAAEDDGPRVESRFVRRLL
eukprot:5089455-Pyramimonas_sp.AAC.1